ncbi:translation initiation factor eIF 4e-like domain-containing protein [Phyllosticta citrichinensis]
MAAEEAERAGDGYISADSSFYGDDETKAELDQESAAFSTRPYWSSHDQLLPTIVEKTCPKPIAPKPNTEDTQTTSQEEPPNEQVEPPSVPNCYQPTETVDEFVKRMSPLDTVAEYTGFPWIWVQSPNSTAYNKNRPDEQAFGAQGEELLESYRQKKANIERDNPSVSKGSVTSKSFKDRIKLKDEIESLMVQTNMVCGKVKTGPYTSSIWEDANLEKWLLRPSIIDAPRFWKQICLGVLDGRLGHTAKIATTSITNPEDIRLICVYTKDCFDIEDMKRVLRALTEMGLAFKDHAIYYKTDAYTHLEIYSDNEFKLQASLCSSKNIWDLKAKKRKAEPQSQPSTWKGKKPALTNFFSKR